MQNWQHCLPPAEGETLGWGVWGVLALKYMPAGNNVTCPTPPHSHAQMDPALYVRSMLKRYELDEEEAAAALVVEHCQGQLDPEIRKSE